MSVTENSLRIDAIEEDLKEKIKFSTMNNVQKRDVIDQLFPDGVAFAHTDPKAAVGDFVFGFGDPAFNGGGFFFAEVASIPVVGDGNLNYKYQS